MRWCEAHNVRYQFGLAQNQRLLKIIGREQHEAKLAFEQSGRASRVFADFTYGTQKSWSAERRVVGKVEYLTKGPNPRFVVTNTPQAERAAKRRWPQSTSFAVPTRQWPCAIHRYLRMTTSESLTRKS